MLLTHWAQLCRVSIVNPSGEIMASSLSMRLFPGILHWLPLFYLRQPGPSRTLHLLYSLHLSGVEADERQHWLPFSTHICTCAERKSQVVEPPVCVAFDVVPCCCSCSSGCRWFLWPQLQAACQKLKSATAFPLCFPSHVALFIVLPHPRFCSPRFILFSLDSMELSKMFVNCMLNVFTDLSQDIGSVRDSFKVCGNVGKTFALNHPIR